MREGRDVCARHYGAVTPANDSPRVHVLSARHCGRTDVYRNWLMLKVDACCGSQEGGAGRGPRTEVWCARCGGSLCCRIGDSRVTA